MKTVSWFSTGVSSFVATWLIRDEIDEIIYIHVEDQHEDSLRYLKDCEKLLGKKITIMQSRFKNVENVCRYYNYVSSVTGAKCTDTLKRQVRIEFEYNHDDDESLTYIWGMDATEIDRAERIKQVMPKQTHRFPLIERNIYKQEAHGICNELCLKRPIMYDLGYNNNNCIGCLKGGMWYWNKIRKDFPEVFKARAKLERELHNTILYKDGKPLYLDELDPEAGYKHDEISTECNVVCQLTLYYDEQNRKTNNTDNAIDILKHSYY